VCFLGRGREGGGGGGKKLNLSRQNLPRIADLEIQRVNSLCNAT